MKKLKEIVRESIPYVGLAVALVGGAVGPLYVMGIGAGLEVGGIFYCLYKDDKEQEKYRKKLDSSDRRY